MNKYKFTIMVEAAEEGGYVASCPALPGCVTEGETYEETISNMQDAVALYVESMKEHGEPIPGDVEVSLNSIEVAA